MEVIQDIKKGKLHSAYTIGAFDKAKEVLEKEGYRIISLEEQAGLRVQGGADSSISRGGNWTKEGFIYVPTKGAFLTKVSPITANAKQATDCHRDWGEFYLDKGEVESALADSVKIEYLQIPTNRFADEALTNFAFGKNAEAYGEFLGENGIDSIQVHLAGSQNEPFARQAWLYWIDCGGWSYLDGNGMDLYCGDFEVRGVREPGIK